MKKDNFKYGSYFKDVTGSSKIPKNTEEIWKAVSKSKCNDEHKLKVKGERYGNDLTPERGNVFDLGIYSSDIDKYL